MINFVYKFKLFLFSFLFILCLIGNVQAIDIWQSLEQSIEQARQDWEVPGVAIAIIKDDEIVFAKGFGLAKADEDIPVNEHTLFAVGSCTKAFTSAALALLVEEGKLRWDDRVINHLEDFQLYDPYVTQELTIRDLLSHRSGLSRADLLWYGTKNDRKEVLHRIRYLKPSWGFRSHYGYQNIMFLAAGEVIPAITGVSWDDFIREHFFNKLSMTNTTTTTDGLEETSYVASPHINVDGEIRPIPWRKIDNVGPAASINSNVMEMAQWIRLQLGKGQYNQEQLISPRAIWEMHSAQMAIPLGPKAAFEYPDARFLSYGLGWFLHDYKGHKVVEHGGAIDGMSALVTMIPEKKLGVVILTNMELTWLPRVLKYEIFDLYLDQPQTDWNAYFLDAFAEMHVNKEPREEQFGHQHAEGVIAPLALNRYVGTYEDALYGNAEISVQNGKLFVEFLGFRGELEHKTKDVFQFDPSVSAPTQLKKWFLKFSVNSEGEVEALNISELGESTFQRMKDKG